MKRSLELARTIAAQSPVAVTLTLQTLRDASEEGLERALWREGSFFI